MNESESGLDLLPSGSVKSLDGLRVPRSENRKVDFVRFECAPALEQVGTVILDLDRVLVIDGAECLLRLGACQKFKEANRVLLVFGTAGDSASTHIDMSSAAILVWEKDSDLPGHLAVRRTCGVGQNAQIISVDYGHIG